MNPPPAPGSAALPGPPREARLRLGSPLSYLLIVLGVLVHLVGYGVFQLFPRPLRPAPPPAAFVSVPAPGAASADPMILDQAMMEDSAPLFLPTRWNFAQNAGPAAVASPLREAVFPPFPEQLTLPLTGFPAGATALPEPPRDLADFLDPGNRSLFSLLGRIPPDPAAPLPPRAAALRVFALPGGRLLRELELPPGTLSLPPSNFWMPARFFLLRTHSGWAGPPLQHTSSGDESVDRTLRAWMQNPSALAFLPPGYYSVTFGP